MRIYSSPLFSSLGVSILQRVFIVQIFVVLLKQRIQRFRDEKEREGAGIHGLPPCDSLSWRGEKVSKIRHIHFLYRRHSVKRLLSHAVGNGQRLRNIGN